MRAVLLLLLLSSPAVAGDFAFELGSDVVHAKGLRVWSLSLENDNSRFRYGEFGQDGVSIPFYGVEYVWHPSSKWAPSFGIVHIDRTTEINGLRWNFLIGLRYQLSKDVFIGLIHASHGRSLGIEENRTNRGWNFVTLGSNF